MTNPEKEVPIQNETGNLPTPGIGSGESREGLAILAGFSSSLLSEIVRAFAICWLLSAGFSAKVVHDSGDPSGCG